MKKFLPAILLLLSVMAYSQNADIRILSEINLNRNKHLDNVFRGITNTAGPVAFGTPVVLFAVSIAWPRWYVIVPSYLWAGAVAYSRMDLGVHYPSDVLAGALIGAGSAFLCYQGQKWLNGRR